MELDFASRGLLRKLSSEGEMQRAWGSAVARKLVARLKELEMARCLEDLRPIRSARCHELSGDRKGQLAMDLAHPFRLVFAPADTPLPVKPDGGLDWKGVTRVVILDIIDYH